MIEVLMALGKFRFSLQTAAYQSLKRTAEYHWPSQARVGREEALQFTGPSSETMQLAGVVYPHFKGGLGQVDTMRKIAGQGKLLPLTDGLGNYWGKWCITRIDEEQSNFAGSGIPKKIGFNLSLQAYGEDRS